ncbi:hypothetical protein GGX14DRAFT_607743 [Mycena pura]|uniref:Uncharacterized protein n=1 Tax=Mycena pura TaxID=153505 RepID=A0AAD6XXQ1_9AGAR|nr:hypothetical protein GGX14DRAFT_607743 [Mycena pura]
MCRRRTLFLPPPAAFRTQSPVDGFTPAFLDGLDDIARSQSFAWDYGPALQQARIDSPKPCCALTLSMAPSSAASSQPPPSQPRVLALSVARKTTLPKPPRITTQLNPACMSQATGTRPANDTFTIRQPSARRAKVDLTTVQHFTLVYWDQDAKPPFILGVTECPSWPKFRLLESTRTLDLLDRNLDAVEYYNMRRICLWTRVELSFTHILTTDTYLLLRHVGVSGADEDRFIDHFVHLPGPQHIRYNMTAEQEAVRRKLKARQTHTDTDNEVEIVRVNGVKVEPVDKPSVADVDRPSQRIARPSLRIVTGSTICMDDTTPPAALTLKWPCAMYVIDMAEGFMEMEAVNVQHIPPAQRFQRVFKTAAKFKQRTYTDARMRWMQGLESLRKAALDAGHTKAGLWSAYAAQVLLKK